MVTNTALLKKLNSTQAGNLGELIVLSGLLERGYIASQTPRNSNNCDILACNSECIQDKFVMIQVKSKQVDSKNLSKVEFNLDKKHQIYANGDYPKLYFAFVTLLDKNVYFIPAKEVGEFIKNYHKTWLETPGKKGQPHNDTNMRSYFVDPTKYHANNYEILGLD